MSRALQDVDKRRTRAFTEEDDLLLISLVKTFGQHWRIIAKQMNRTPKVCQMRWQYLQTNNATGVWTQQDDFLLEQLINKVGTSWTYIARFFPAKTIEQIKERWTKLRKHTKRAVIKDKPVTINKDTMIPVPSSIGNIWLSSEMANTIYTQIVGAQNQIQQVKQNNYQPTERPMSVSLEYPVQFPDDTVGDITESSQVMDPFAFPDMEGTTTFDYQFPVDYF